MVRGGAGWRAPDQIFDANVSLLELDGRTCFFEFLLDRLGFVFSDGFLDGLRRAFDKILRLFQAKTGNGPDLFDDVDLLVASRGKNDVEFGLFLGCGGIAGARGNTRDGNRRGGLNTPLFFEHLGKLGRLNDGQARKILNDLL